MRFIEWEVGEEGYEEQIVCTSPPSYYRFKLL